MCEGGDEKIQKNENEIKTKLRKDDFSFQTSTQPTYLIWTQRPHRKCVITDD